ncbi:MAG: undecaprenyl-diphosphate phosphatase [Candidatus Fimadaptatus sp.]|jgi:undecaprenyl-diphosphatase
MDLSIFQAVMLGLTQGLSEFLPISSSGHLMLVQKLLDIPSTGLLLEVLLHVGTLIAVLAVYFKLFFNMIRHPIRSLLPELVVATIPAVIATLLFGDFFDAAFEGKFLGFSFLITSALLLLSDFLSKRVVTHDRLTWRDTIIMGIMQAFAILPGVSRSGSTIAAGVSSGLKRKKAADFSFMMSAPAILGSLVMSLKDLLTGQSIDPTGVNWLTVLLAMAVAAISGFLAIKFMLRMIRRCPLRYFAIYTTILGIYVLLDQYYLHFLF